MAPGSRALPPVGQTSRKVGSSPSPHLVNLPFRGSRSGGPGTGRGPDRWVVGSACGAPVRRRARAAATIDGPGAPAGRPLTALSNLDSELESQSLAQARIARACTSGTPAIQRHLTPCPKIFALAGRGPRMPPCRPPNRKPRVASSFVVPFVASKSTRLLQLPHAPRHDTSLSGGVASPRASNHSDLIQQTCGSRPRLKAKAEKCVSAGFRIARETDQCSRLRNRGPGSHAYDHTSTRLWQ
ncbi:hypothetical protein C2E23DRAFT_220905 [Lenzites betulinus]|nr:hypothetical protein C2E23DRAFT_220905 [Lenzites betulinus]